MTELGLVAMSVAAVSAFPPTLVAYAALRSSRKNSVKCDVISEKADESLKSSQGNSIKCDAIAVKADEIHVLANSQLTVVTASLKAANEKIDKLEKLVASLAMLHKRKR